MIHRIIERPSHFSIKKLKDEYDLKQKYKENMSKKKILDRIQLLVKSNPMVVLLEEAANSDSSPENKKTKLSTGTEEKPGKSQIKLEWNAGTQVNSEEKLRDKLKNPRVKVRQSEANLNLISLNSLSNEENLIKPEVPEISPEHDLTVNILKEAQDLIHSSLSPS